MREILFTILMFLCLTAGAAAQEAAIVWEKDYKTAQRLARESGRPLLLYFTAAACKPCRALDAGFWSLPDVVKGSKRFVAVRINIRDDRESAKKYKVSRVPFAVVADPLGNPVRFRRGTDANDPEKLKQVIEYAREDFSGVKKFYDALDVKPDDGAALYEIAEYYRKLGLYALTGDFYTRALATSEIRADAVKREAILSAHGLILYDFGEYAAAAKRWEEYLKDFPAGINRALGIHLLAMSNVRLGNLNAAAGHLQTLKRDFPESGNIPTLVEELEIAGKKAKRQKRRRGAK